MKARFLIAVVLAIFCCTTVFAAEVQTTTTPAAAQSSSPLNISAVNDYGYITTAGNTERFYLQMQNPCNYQVSCDVRVMINGRCEGRKPVIIRAGSSISDATYIKVGTAHKGQRYTLELHVYQGDDNM